MDHHGDSDTNYNCCIWNNPQRIGKGTEKIEIRGQEEIIQHTALLRSVRMLGKVLETCVKNSLGVTIIIFIKWLNSFVLPIDEKSFIITLTNGKFAGIKMLNVKATIWEKTNVSFIIHLFRSKNSLVFGLVSFFNSISNFVGYLMPKPYL